MVKSSHNEAKGISWKKGGQAYNLARAMLIQGTLSGNENSGVVHDSNDIFREVSKKSFASGLIRLKEELGVQPGIRSPKILKHIPQIGTPKPLVSGIGSDEECEDDDSSFAASSNAAYRKRAYGTGNMVEDKSNTHGREQEELDVKNFLTWVPPHLVVPWEGENARKMVTVVVPMYQGLLSDCTDSKVILEKGGNRLKISAKWPSIITDTTSLHKYWNSARTENQAAGTTSTQVFPKFHPKIIAFDKVFQKLGEIQEDDLWSQAFIKLPFQAQEEDMECHRIGDKKSGAYIMYINLKSFGGKIIAKSGTGPMLLVD